MSTWGQSRGKAAGRGGGSSSGQCREEEIVDISDESFWEPRPRDVDRDSDGEGAEETAGLDAFPEDIELVITSVMMLKRPKHRYRISFGKYSLEIHEDVMIKYRMMKGAVFTKVELEEIVAADGRQQGYADALKYLSLKPRTTYEITQRLGEKGWGEETIQDVLVRLQSEGYVDDAAYAQEWASQRVKLRGKGKLWVKHELRQKGVSKSHIEEALGEVSEDDEFESALQLGLKKWQGTTGEPLDRKRKTGAFLQRRGFSGGVVSRVMRELGNREQMHGMDEWDEE
ncbi:RecX family transcriptional regulator [Paenibacillus sp. MBLB2552]|uniref:Regulatory protein RecX n=1 Tax=Paenibacillus mellifer TaxID=2937794 RepID=A0A9X2BSQ5_9BACL|nr:RecX family transcriptional regulator [Paenibacillus mellifer]MCK8488675.1 RecX family transcriptional regulator [Paenibacillus mellifer]